MLLSFNSNAELKLSLSPWLQTGKVAEICDLRFALGARARMKTNGKENYRVLPRQNLEAIGAVGANLRPFFFGGSLNFECYATMPMLSLIHI